MSVPDSLPQGSDFAGLWSLDREIVFLNHGSFGACPVAVMEHREKLLRQAEKDPMEFLLEKHQPLLYDCLSEMERFTGAQKGSIVLVENATTAVNTFLRNLPVKPGDTVLVSDQEYFSSANSLHSLSQEKGFSVRKVNLPFPVQSEEEILQRFNDAVDASVRYALVDHIISSTGMVLPLKRIIDLLSESGVETVVDGAHGPGQVPLNLTGMGCLAYTGNCHKWLCSPRSAAIMYVRPDFQSSFKPLVVSHLPETLQTELSDYQLYFRWNGTPDPTPQLSIPYCLDYMSNLHPAGWSGIMESNRLKALQARELLCEALQTEPPCPSSMVGSMAAIPLTDMTAPQSARLHWRDPLQRLLRDRYGIVVPVTAIKQGFKRMVRISAQLYNSPEQYEYLGRALVEAGN